MPSAGYLLVRAGGRLVGLPVAQVVEVVEPGEAYPVPSVEPAVRGVVVVRGRILPLIHLGALLDGVACPPASAVTNAGVGVANGIIVALGRNQFCLEVDGAELVVRASGMPVPPGTALPGAIAVARYGEDLVPLLDLHTLAGVLGAAAAQSREAESG